MSYSSTLICPGCHNSLTLEKSVVRSYINKSATEDDDNVIRVLGYYSAGEFEPNNFNGFGGALVDLPDDSDSCASCDHAL